MANDLHEFAFRLKVEDGWPPVSVEALYFLRTTDGAFQLKSAPFFLKDFSVDDVFLIEAENAVVTSWKRISRSARSTVWLQADEGIDIEDVLDDLKRAKCNVERLRNFGLFSIDVPPECSEAFLDECLDRLPGDGVAVAFPSFRH